MKIYLYMLVMAVTTYLIRVLPLTVFRKRIKSRFLRSFLFYIPCSCLAAMTFPSIVLSTSNVISGVSALAIALFLAYKEKSLVVVASGSCAAVFVVERIIEYLPKIL